MAELPDPTSALTGEALETYRHMASVRAHAEGRTSLGEVYVRMFNNPGVATRVGALGEHLRFNGTLPDDVRELVILRCAMRNRSGYEWSHHQRPASLAGVSPEVIDQLRAGDVPPSLPDATQAVIEAVDHVTAHRSIPMHAQRRIVDVHGVAGAVEVVALCGLYGLMSYMVFAFDIEVEAGLPAPPADWDPPEVGPTP